MRTIYAAIALSCLIGTTSAQPQAPVAEVDLPYSACGDMAVLRANLTGTPNPTPQSDANLWRLGVRCIGPADAPRVRQRY
jgi:hypothetical protein